MLLNDTTVRGVIVQEGSSPVAPASDIRVHLGALQGGRFQLLGEALTDKTGQFSFSMDELPSPDGSASSFEIRLFSKGVRITAHGDTRWRRGVDPGPMVICAEIPTSCALPVEPFPEGIPGSHNVWGRVRHLDGTPLVSVLVDVREVTFGGETPLSTVMTDGAGWYGTTISTPKDIVVQVLEPSTPPAPPRLLGGSRAYFSPAYPLRIDLQISDDKYRRQTEWNRINAALPPLTGGTPPQNLQVRQMAVLSGKTGWDVERISLWSLAHRLGAGDPESVYGLLRMGFPRSKEALLARPRATVGPALVRAAALNIIQASKSVSPGIDGFLSGFSTSLQNALNGMRQDTLGSILRASGVLNPGQITLFISTWVNHTGPEEGFWALFPQAGFDAAATDEAKRLLTLGSLSLSFAPIVASILVTIGTGPASAVAGISMTGWNTIVSSGRLGVLPSGLPGADDAARRTALAGYLAEHAERMFPSLTARNQLISVLSGHPAAAFMSANPSFDLAKSRVDDAATGTSEQRDAAKRVQRLYRVAPSIGRSGAVFELENAGISSAAAVVRMGRARFVASMSAGMSAEVAEEVFRKATALQAITTTFLLQAHPRNSQANYRFLANTAFDTADLPDWDTLFGNAGGCACTHCRSVHSPPAYLVDLLQWLEARLISGGSTSLYEELISRRPDLAEVELSCENAERALPYIDLVMEALESAVANGSAPGQVGTDAAHNSTVTTADMLASPQYRNEAAYAELAVAKRSMKLPFHRSLEESRAFLTHLGVARDGLLRTFRGVGGVGPSEIAEEELGLFAGRMQSIRGGGTELDYWPVASLGALASVVTLQKAVECTWPELQDLFHTRFVNARTWTGSAWGRRLVLAGTEPCDITTWTVQLTAGGAPAETDWRTLRRFVRLWRVTGGTALALDKVLAALAITDLSADTWAGPMAALKRLGALTGLSLEELAATQALSMDTFEDRSSKAEPVLSLYDRVYRSPAVMVEGDPAFSIFLLNGQRDELASITSPPLQVLDQAASVAAALGLTQEELVELHEELPSGDLTLANLTALYAWSVMCRAVGLRPAELRALVAMIQPAPTEPPTPPLSPRTSLTTLVGLVELAQELRTLGWTVDELYYLTHHERADRVGLTDSAARLILGRIRDAVRQDFASLGVASTEASVRETVLRALAQGFGVEADTLNGLRSLSWADLTPLIPSTGFQLAEDAGLSLDSPMDVTIPVGTRCVLPEGTAVVRGSTPETLLADEEVYLSVGSVVVQANLLTMAQGSAWSGSGEDAASFASGVSFSILEAELSSTATFTSFVGNAQGVNVTLPSPPATVTVGLPDRVRSTLSASVTGTMAFVSAPPSPDLLQRFIRTDFQNGGILGAQPYDDIATDGIYEGDFLVLRALHKAVLALKHLQLDERERAFWFTPENCAAWELMAVDELTAGPPATPIVLQKVLNLLRLFALRADIPGTSPAFVDLLGAGDFAAALAERTGWNAEDIGVVAAQVGATPDSADGLRALLGRMDIIRRVGASAQTVAGWITAAGSVTDVMSAEVVAAARGRAASEEGWAEVARPVRDVLRKAQRDALVAWLMALAVQSGDASIRTVEDLYERYLIDVSMNPEMLTSRIVQACATVQLFVHRLLLGLEQNGSGVALFEANAEDREQWEWMRTYRVWEAARKVFLYPENWIEPELRDDKTAFFRTLEQELAAGDVTEERVEQVLLDYLDRLREISHLKVLAYAHQKEAPTGGDGIDRLHVFARTRSTPATYWYRSWEKGLWSAWEKVECGLEGEYLVPAIYERRLLLFWGTLSEASDGGDTTFTEMRLSWSEYRDGKWSPKRISEGVPVSAEGPRIMVVRGPDVDGRLAIHVTVRHTMLSVQTHEIADTGTIRVRYLLDPCTLELVGAQVEESEDRLAAVGSIWGNPGFLTGYGFTPHELAVYRAELDASGAPVGSLSSVPLLGDVFELTLVAPAESADFVSQSPFFVQNPTRAWFVLSGTPAPTQSGSGTAALVGGLSGLRRGTSVQVEGGPAPTDPALLAQWSSYLPVPLYLAEQTAVDALTAVDRSLVSSIEPSSFDLVSGAYQFLTFYHPHVCTFTEAVRRAGVFALLDPDPDGPEAHLSTGSLRRQQLTGSFDFEAELAPDPDNVAQPYPVEDVDFSASGAYSVYNWEVFYHLPLYVTARLMDAGRHETAMKFLHAVFDPRVPASDVPPGFDASARFWKVVALMEPASAPVTDWIAFMGGTGAAAGEEFVRQVDAWRNDPFNPHLLARLRPGTYGKVAVMRYIENLIAWGDQLFSRDSLESLNEATQLYVFARQILGDRPEIMEPTTAPTVKTYAALKSEGAFDAFGNIVLENACTVEVSATGTGSPGTALLTSTGLTTYFCVPANAKLLSMWDLVDDRLFKLRNGMNIDGVSRTLPLFQPPIDPAMLVRAAAAGMDIGTTLNDLAVTLPNHRFAVMHGRASALAGSVRSLGQALLSAIEKKDAEELTKLRQEQEQTLLAAVETIRDQQVEEAEQSLASIKASRKTVKARKDYYAQLMDKGWNGEEIAAAALQSVASAAELSVAGFRLIQSALSVNPNVTTGTLGLSIGIAIESGGEHLSRAPGIAGDVFEFLVSSARASAAYLNTTGAYKRRADEWKQQEAQAAKDLEQIDTQIEGAKIRVEIAKKERANHDIQVAHSEQVAEFLSRKFGTAALYQWMIGQLSALYFQQYQLALATAKKAQSCFNYELGRSDSFLQPLYWDSLRNGLLAGERLSADLERMDIAYLERDVREYELTRHISLMLLDPMAVERLKVDGECYFSLPEALFDLDCPSHYFRRIQSLALSFACIGGVQGTVNAKLTLHRSQLRKTASGDPEEESSVGYPAIVTSGALNDSGVFSADPRDPRYLPFERKGACSTWHLRFTARDIPQFDWSLLEDVTVHLRYTAREGGTAREDGTAPSAVLASLAIGQSRAAATPVTGGFVRVISAKRDAPDVLAAARLASATTLTLSISQEQLAPSGAGTLQRILFLPILAGIAEPTSIAGKNVLTFGTELPYAPWETTLPTLPGDLSIALADADYADLTDLLLVLVYA